MMKKYFFSGLLLILSCSVVAQNWPTFGGGSSRSGLSRMTGPQSALSPLWTITNASPTTLGNAVYTFGDKLVTSRAIFSPYTGMFECRDLQNGGLLWNSPFISPGSILYVIGFSEDGVYAHDYATDTIYSFDPDNGSIQWRSSVKSQTFGAYPGCVFACNGDLIVNGPLFSGKFTMRLDRSTGDTVWTNSELIAIGPAVGLAANDEKVYRITGGITIPILLTAIDINTGVTLYHSLPIAGDPDQENPITLGPDNRIYFWRDGGNFHAYEDAGNGLFPVWEYVPQTTTGAALSGNISIGPDSSIYIFDQDRIRRLDHATGQVIDSSAVIMPQGAITIDADGTVYANNKDGSYYALTNDLQTIKWQLNVGGNTYNNMAVSKDGIMVITGAGSVISALQTLSPLAPVVDFRVSDRNVVAGQPVDFYDQTSVFPASWTWYFPGSTTVTSTAQNPSGIIYNTAGIYEVTLVAQNSIGSDSVTKSCYIEVSGTIGISEPVDHRFDLYPNPAVDLVHLVFDKSSQVNKIRVEDLSGRIVLEKTALKPETILDVSGLNPGIYFVSTDERDAFAVKLIRN